MRTRHSLCPYYFLCYSNFSSHSTISTAALLLTATRIKLFPRNASTTAVIRAAAPLITDSVLLRIAGKIMAVRQQ